MFERNRLKPPVPLLGDCLDLAQPRLLQRWVVVAVEIVDTHNAVALLKEALGQSGTNKSRRAGNQNSACHQPSPSPIRHNLSPAAFTATGSTTARASNTHAGRRIKAASSDQFSWR